MTAPFDFRSVLLKVQDLLSDADRQRLHFLFGDNVPRHLRDDQSVGGALRVFESLIDRAIINEEDCHYLIESFNNIQCYDAAKRLQEYQRVHQQGVKENTARAKALFEQDQEDKFCSSTVGYDKSSSLINVSRSETLNNPMISQRPPPCVDTKKETEKNAFCCPETNFKRRNLIRPAVLLCTIIVIVLALVAIIILRPIEKKPATIDKNKGPIKGSDGICSIARWNPVGVTVAGNGSQGKDLYQLSRPNGIFVDENGTIYVADTSNDRIVKWTGGASKGSLVAGGNGRGNATDQLAVPTDVVVDKTGTMYIGDYQNERIVKWSPGAKNGQTMISNLSSNGLALDDQESLYISDLDNDQVIKWGKSNNESHVLLSKLSGPSWLFVDRSRSVYVPDRDHHRVIKVVDGSSEVLRVAGDGSPGVGIDQLNFPQGVTVDKLGNIYVADTKNHRIIRWLPKATSGTVIVGGRGEGSRSDQLNTPTDLQFDRNGNLYVVDAMNHRVQKFSLDPSSCQTQR